MRKPGANRLGPAQERGGGAAAPVSPGLILTERESIVARLRILTDHIGARPAGSEDAARARRYLVRAIRDLGFSPEIQPFFTASLRYERCELVTEGGRAIPCLPVIGSASTPGTLRGIPRAFPRQVSPPRDPDLEYEGVVLLCPVGRREGSENVRFASERKAAAVFFYHDGVPDLYSEVLPDLSGAIPCVTIRRADAQRFEWEHLAIRLTLTGKPVRVSCSNIMVEAGERGRPLLFLAHYDTRPGSPGAIRNASGVAALLELLARFRGWTGQRILVGFVDGEELGAAGSRHCCDVLQAVGGLKNLRGVVYVSGMGLRGLAVLSSANHSASHLVNVAGQCAADEGLLLSEELFASGEIPIPHGIWPCPAIALSGPPVAIQHTSADRPDLLHPELLLRSVSVLECLARVP